MRRGACPHCARHLWPFFCLEEVFDFTSFFLTFTHKPLWTVGECKIAALFWSDEVEAAKALKNGTQPTETPAYTANKISFMLNHCFTHLIGSFKSLGQCFSCFYVFCMSPMPLIQFTLHLQTHDKCGRVRTGDLCISFINVIYKIFIMCAPKMEQERMADGLWVWMSIWIHYSVFHQLFKSNTALYWTLWPHFLQLSLQFSFQLALSAQFLFFCRCDNSLSNENVLVSRTPWVVWKYPIWIPQAIFHKPTVTALPNFKLTHHFMKRRHLHVSKVSYYKVNENSHNLLWKSVMKVLKFSSLRILDETLCSFLPLFSTF